MALTVDMDYRLSRPMVDGATLFGENENLSADKTYGPIDIGTGHATGTLTISGAAAASGAAVFKLYGSTDNAGADKTQLAQIDFSTPEVQELRTVTFTNQLQNNVQPFAFITLEGTITAGFDLTIAYLSELASQSGARRR